MELHDILTNLQYFQPYIKKSHVKKQLNQLQLFPTFDEVYSQMRQENEDSYAWYITCLTLVKGIELGELNLANLNELIFRLLEDSLFKSYIYKLNSYNIKLDDLGSLSHVLRSWGVPTENVLLKNVIQSDTSQDFVISGYRVFTDREKISAIRLILLDKELVKIHQKNEDEFYLAYPTIVEFDFQRELIHIRQRGVENIESELEEISTMKGRIDNTLDFISSLRPSITFEKINNCRSTLFHIEENLLQDKRDACQQMLESFNDKIDAFTQEVINTFSPPETEKISPKNYISFAVQSIIASTLRTDDLGDIIGIRFRNSREDESQKYAQVYISDKGYKSISSDELYWLNLPVLQEQQEVEFLKIAKTFPSGFAIFTLEYTLDTLKVQLLQRSPQPDEDLDRQPTDEKYNEIIDFIVPFL